MSGAWRRQIKRCEKKKQYNSLSEANRIINELPDTVKRPRPMRAYLCKICGKIHIGHVPRTELRIGYERGKK